MKKLLFLSLLAALLGACVPAEKTEKVKVVQNVAEVSYYPHEVGARWEYLAEGEAIDSSPVVSTVLGPTVANSEIWIVTHMVGQGLDVAWFRQYRDDGVYLLKEERPGQVVSYNPPLKEFPKAGSLRVGAVWDGNSSIEVYYPLAEPKNQLAHYDIHYSYTVVDERTVTLATGETKVFVIDFVASDVNNLDSKFKTYKQETWFSPYLGEVKTEDGFLLVKTNLVGLKQK